MLHVATKDLYNKENSLLWCVLSFKAGLLNAAGFLIAGSYVSHVTGFGTQVGIAIGHSSYDFGLELFVIPLSFIGGAFLTSLILDQNYSEKRVPNYPHVQVLITFLLGLVSALFSFGFFSTERPSGPNTNSLLLVGILCLVCGLKNGLTTWATQGKIRTTHLTGLATDIGLHLPKLFKNYTSRLPESKRINQVRILTLLSFSLGSCLSALLIPAIGYKIFYLSFGISLVLSLVSVLHRKLLTETQLKLRTGGMYANLN